MSLDYAILGFLNYAPLSGYDLKKAFDTSVRHFWQADQSQIYRTLNRLADQGLAEVEVVEQEDRPDRKVYHITEAGREELRQWLSTPLSPLANREPLLVQVFFSGQLPDEEILAIFEREAEQTRARLAVYRRIPEESRGYMEFGSPREVFFWMLTLEHGIVMAEAKLKWVEGVIERFRVKSIPPPEAEDVQTPSKQPERSSK